MDLVRLHSLQAPIRKLAAAVISRSRQVQFPELLRLSSSATPPLKEESATLDCGQKPTASLDCSGDPRFYPDISSTTAQQWELRLTPLIGSAMKISGSVCSCHPEQASFAKRGIWARRANASRFLRGTQSHAWRATLYSKLTHYPTDALIPDLFRTFIIVGLFIGSRRICNGGFL